MPNKKILTSDAIKLIAIFAMTLDHIAWLLFPDYSMHPTAIILHIIGRITCPVMCYFIAEGYHYTKNINKYTFRLFAFAAISHFAYIYASWDYTDATSFIPFYDGNFFNQTSVMWSLAWGLVMLRVVYSEKIKHNWQKFLILFFICLISFPADWSCIAALCILAIGMNRENFKTQMLWMTFFVFTYSVVYFFAMNRIYGVIQMAVVLSIPVLNMYNGKRSNSKKLTKAMKWLFYIYYPAHLFMIGIVREFM